MSFNNSVVIPTWDNKTNTMTFDCPIDPEYFHVPIFAQQVISLILNTAIFLFIVTSCRLRKRFSNRIFLNLPITHILMSIVLITAKFNVVYALHMAQNALLLQTFFSLMATSLDRVIAIKYPFRYSNLRIKHALLASLIIVACTLIFYGVMYNVNHSSLAVIATSMITSICIVLIVMDLTLFIIARNQINEIRKSQCNQKCTISKAKSAATCFTLVLSFVILWTPTAIYHVLILTGQRSLENYECDDFLHVSGVMSHMSPILDPFIYVLFRKDIKQELKRRFNRETYIREISLFSRSASFETKRFVTTKNETFQNT